MLIDSFNVIQPPALISGLQYVSLITAAIIGFIGVIIMAFGALYSASLFILSVLQRKNHLPQIRIELGKYLALGLEFLVGKDIIETIVHPTWTDLGKLAAIVALRTVITLFLSWELKDVLHGMEEEQEMAKMVSRQKKSS
ncbi:hypothetical protein COU78_04815 [Candidatus Peregrinibacteria bacterium CG10_big_fil_rev_8_21_14_0_10_49_24]|nr:MAG: hypothetical protein COV83_03960 [Candidatus Peregrinibacteria bacterium CG11_big_fil_rev_8_21_14_0_20_49_14]PIR50671.1 MAG: hypothetical protein COU78_04815 [Candidatus Peregrinibacteria bacterium CG10_big_fil_rev_8_21_14_0_10_49_24]PJA67433.1 MAG: hypothetical protein CO157_04515 [Candidatus Peregrinibacteria bacterium CG_4_9_14_3_um_filter_49_12]